MLFGCKLRWTQKFPGTKQKAKLVNEVSSCADACQAGSVPETMGAGSRARPHSNRHEFCPH